MNKSIIKLGFMATMLLLTTAIQAKETSTFDYHLNAKKISDNVYCFFGALESISNENGGNMVNSCYVQTKKSFVVIDSGPTFAYAKQAYAQMQKIAKLPVK